MRITRREALRLGGLGALASVAADLPAAAPALQADPPGFPLDPRHLAHGLDLLCNAHSTDSFRAGHAGGAVISAYYLCREEELEPGTAEVIQGALDRHYPLAAGPFPDEDPVEDGIAQILRAREPDLGQLCREGHDVIFLSLALRAMHELPRAVTPARIAGLLRTLRSLEPKLRGHSDIAVPESESAFAEFVLEEFLASTEGGPGQGFSGHLLTHGRAILDLRLLGHERFAGRCLHAFGLAVGRARPRTRGPHWRAERPRVEFRRPDRKEYWERRAAAGTVELGHLFKYPYGFLGLRRLSGNRALNEVCAENSYRLFKS